MFDYESLRLFSRFFRSLFDFGFGILLDGFDAVLAGSHGIVAFGPADCFCVGSNQSEVALAILAFVDLEFITLLIPLTAPFLAAYI